MFDIVKETTADNLYMYGLLAESKNSKTAVIHIHGFEDDFFTNLFIPVVAKKLREAGVSFLTVQTRGMGDEYKFHTHSGSRKRYGAHHELLEEAYLDIDTWVKYLKKKGYTRIILQGYSLGTMKVIRYLFEGTYKKEISNVILLAPFDNTSLVKKYSLGYPLMVRLVASFVSKMGFGKYRIPFIRAGITFNTYLSWVGKDELSHVFDFYDKTFTFDVLKKISVPVMVIVGTEDEFFHSSNVKNPEEAMDILKKNIKIFSGKLLKGAGHGFFEYEEELARDITRFVSS